MPTGAIEDFAVLLIGQDPRPSGTPVRAPLVDYNLYWYEEPRWPDIPMKSWR